jgi:PadR family transcriptional regulator PadR
MGRPPDGTVYKVDSSTLWTMGRTFLGEFEQRVLLAILRCDAKAYPIEIRKEVARATGHEPSRGAFYTTLDRLEAKQLLRWTAEGGDAGRDGLPQRKFIVTAEGMKALRASRRALLELWSGLDEVLGES